MTDQKCDLTGPYLALQPCVPVPSSFTYRAQSRPERKV